MKTLVLAGEIFTDIDIPINIKYDPSYGVSILRVKINYGWAAITRNGNIDRACPVKHFTKHNKKSLLSLWLRENHLAGASPLQQTVENELKKTAHEESITEQGESNITTPFLKPPLTVKKFTVIESKKRGR